MNTHIRENFNGNGFSRQVLTTCSEIETAFAETLLDNVEEAQAQLQSLNQDISLLETAENALDLVSENLSGIHQMVKLHQKGSLSHSEFNEVNDRINNLLMVTMLVLEDTEYNGHNLFKEGMIELNGTGSGQVYLVTSRIPEIEGLETNDYQSAMDSLKEAALVINRQYQRIGTVLQILLDGYHQLCNEIDMLTSEQQRLKSEQRTSLITKAQ